MGAATEPVRFLFEQSGNDIIEQLHRLAEQERPALIIVDTLQRLIRAKDLNDYAEVTTRLTPILTLARETGAAVVLVHHASKGDRAGIDAILGTTALAGSVDNVLLYNRTERYRILSSVQRIGPDLPETVITLDTGTGRVGLGLTRHDTEVAEMEQKILEVLKTASEPMQRKDIEERIEGRPGPKRGALQHLVDRGLAVRSGAGRRGDPYLYSLSCSLVPPNTPEQENTKPLSAISACADETNSCSRDIHAGGVARGLWEQERMPVEEVEL
jgi:hypothetical protein